ncbi:type I methionyl aminopeptidase [Candidatus Oleimmundimicrobium sp.]|uniref:type I methionyl aminopeptidase n=1 Tax=Candidatus Oleimmundimicrobium sp. TaxID=3060597 RepID=UPI0027220EC3|nr:type I methionyl aminopeptidase [Candidatus Oleimmundimicrobium sp.]MDO8886041.1 type I methionyl aminopeptidase [Candidatus Oleimmundimicrobium sp.]
MIIIKSSDEIKRIREAGKIVGTAIKKIENLIEPGMTTAEIDDIVQSTITKMGGRPAFKGYRGFPASACVSVNEEVVHGIPGSRKIRSGDIVGIDVGVEYQGCYADAAATFPVGKISEQASTLINVTRKALSAGIEKCVVGNKLYDISHAIQKVVENAGFSIVRDFVGHGVGLKLHEDPPIPNYGLPNRGPTLKKGMVFAIEPMVNMGNYSVKILKNNWTVVTCDGSLSAHFEHTVVITPEGSDILTFW